MLRIAITDGRLRPGLVRGPETEPARRLVARCGELAAEGVDYLLIREKNLEARELVALSRNVVAAVRATNPAAKVLIARRPDVAVAAGADGVHLSATLGELTPAQVRQLMPETFVSVSCHTLDEVAHARDLGASAILFGPVFGKVVDGVEVVPGIGLDRLREACALAGPTPVFALGGVMSENTWACENVGSAGVAGIRLFFG